MATNRGTRWANTELLNLHSSLNELLICIENEKTNTSRKGRRQRAPRNTVKQALDDVREDLDDIAKHPYNIVHSSANPGDKRLKPEARGSVRRLYTELKRLLESPDPGYHEEKVEEHLKSLVSMLVPNPPEAEATAKDSTEEEAATTSSGPVLRDVGQQDLNVDKMFDRVFEGVDLKRSAAEQDDEQNK